MLMLMLMLLLLLLLLLLMMAVLLDGEVTGLLQLLLVAEVTDLCCW
jgi:Ca2+/Na+ antiporter